MWAYFYNKTAERKCYLEAETWCRYCFEMTTSS